MLNLVKESVQTILREMGYGYRDSDVSADLPSPSDKHYKLFEYSLFSQTLIFF